MTGPMDDELGRLISAALTDRADSVDIRDLRDEPAPNSAAPARSGGPGRRVWAVPLLAAAAVVVIAGGTAGVVALDSRGSGGPAAPSSSTSTSLASGASTGPVSSTAAAGPGRAAKTTTPTASVLACQPGGLQLSTRRETTQSGDAAWIVLVYTNTSTVTCSISGYPSAEVLDATGAVIEHIPVWDGAGGLPSWPRTAGPVVLSPSATASALIQWGAAAYQSGTRCSVNRDVRVAAPSGGTAVSLASDRALGFPIRMCGEAVTAFVNGSTGRVS